VTSNCIDILFVFIDSDAANLYQLRQWKQTLARIRAQFTVGVLYKADFVESELAKMEIPGFKFDKEENLIGLLEVLDPKILLYSNQNAQNFFVLRHTRSVHVFVSHGESDKAYMFQNTIKRYDLYFAAGEAARQRISTNVKNYDVESRIQLIGRPQLNDVFTKPMLPQSLSKSDVKILYAPTWEGVTRSTRYSSIRSHGLLITEEFLQNDDFIFVYRPHPLTGTREVEFREASETIQKLVERSPRSFTDTSEFGWHLKYFDILITDVSAVAYDWLATGKPFFLTKPEDPQAKVDGLKILQEMRAIPMNEARNIIDMVTEVCLGKSAKGFKPSTLRSFYFREPIEASDVFLKDALNRAMELQSTIALSPTNRLRPFYLRSFLRIVLRYIDSAVRKILAKLRLLQLTDLLVRNSKNDQIYVNFSDSTSFRTLVKRIEKLASLNQDAGKPITILVNQPSVFMYLRIKKRSNLLFREVILEILLIKGAEDCEKVMNKVKPAKVFYLKHHPLNVMLLRLNGTRHILFRPEDDHDFVVDHSIVVYDEIQSSSAMMLQKLDNLLEISRPTSKILLD